jgi:hypothetical protein
MDTHDPVDFTRNVVYRLAFSLARRHIDMVGPVGIGSDPPMQLKALTRTVRDEIGGPVDFAQDIARGVSDALAVGG